MLTFIEVAATFAFTVANGHVGEALPFQIVVTSLAHQVSRPITLSHLLLAFTSGLRSVEIRHDSHVGYERLTEKGLVHFYAPSLRKEASGTLQGTCNLEISPGSTKVISLTALPLDAGEIEVSKISLCVEADQFDFEHAISGSNCLTQQHLWTADGKGLFKGETKSGRSTTIEILPKPPKIRIELPNVLKAYFTGEHVSIDIQVRNEEEEESNVDIEVSFLDQADPTPVLRWAATPEGSMDALDQNQSSRIKTSLGVIRPSGTRRLTVKFQAKPETAQCTFDIQCRYFLLSDPETPVSKAFSVDMHFMRPFEANFDYVPQVQDEPLSNYFHISAVESPGSLGSKNAGTSEIKQRWAATAAIASFASTDLTIEAVDLQLATTPQKAACDITPEVDSSSVAATISPYGILKRQFMLDLHRLSIEDQQTTCFDLRLRITWLRDIPDAPSATAILPLPELVASFGEPRVLASASQFNISLNTIYLDYMIENPSMHVLSFNITMDANEDFAFSGPKAVSVQLIPYSYHFIRYTLLPLVRGKSIYPQIKIVDVVWNKMLKVHASRGMRSDKRGISIWIDSEG